MTRKPSKCDQAMARKQAAYYQAMLDKLLNQSAIFRRQYRDLEAYFPGWRLEKVEVVG